MGASTVWPLAEGRTAFDLWWSGVGDWVEPPNQRRGGESGVLRMRDQDARLCYVKRQIDHLYRSWLHPLGRPTAMREAAALHAWRAIGVRVPEVLFSAARQVGGQWQALLVTEALEGFQDLEHWYAQGGLERDGEALHARLLEAIGTTLARLHRERWQHGCLYPKHIFFRVHDGEVEVALLDLEKSRRRWSGKRAARHDFRQLRRHTSWKQAEWTHLVHGYRLECDRLLRGMTS